MNHIHIIVTNNSIDTHIYNGTEIVSTKTKLFPFGLYARDAERAREVARELGLGCKIVMWRRLGNDLSGKYYHTNIEIRSDFLVTFIRKGAKLAGQCQSLGQALFYVASAIQRDGVKL